MSVAEVVIIKGLALVADSVGPTLVRSSERLADEVLEATLGKAVGAATAKGTQAVADSLPGASAARVVDLTSHDPIIKTADSLRTLIRLPGYGADPQMALRMEHIIGQSREAVLSGGLATRSQLEQQIVARYATEVVGREIIPRKFDLPDLKNPYTCLGLGEKNRAYTDQLAQWVRDQPEKTYVQTHYMRPRREPDPSRISRALIGDREYQFTRTTLRVDKQTPWISFDLTNDGAAVEAANTRSSQLFDGIMSDRHLPKTEAYVQNSFEHVGELEWLNAQTWKYTGGTSGISQLEARTWLELAGIDTGRYRAFIDPNLEAHVRTLPDYVKAYRTFFEPLPH